MSACDLAIEFDRSDRVYHGGEVVRGRVIVAVSHDVECNGLRLERSWHTAGKGNADHGVRATANLFAGAWKAGQRFECPFHFTAPAAPLSYRGDLIRIEHYVEVRADLPWAFDPKQREPFYVVGGGEGGPIETGPIPVDRDPERGFLDQLAGPTGFIIAAVAFFLGVAVLPFAVVLWPLAIALVAYNVLRSIAAARLGRTDVALPILVHPGDTAPLRISFEPTATVRYTRIEARLIGVERAASGSGKNRRTHRHTIHERVVRIADRGEMPAGSRTEFTGAIPIPQTAAYSVAAANNQIVWRIVLRVRMPNWPAWKQTRVLRLLPMTAESSERPAERSQHPVEPKRAAAAPRVAPPPPPPRPALEPLAEPEPIAAASYDLPDAPAIPDAPPLVSEPEPTADRRADPLTVTTDMIPSPVSPLDADASPPPPPPPIAAPLADVAAALDRLATADRFNGERDRLLADLAAVPFPFTVRLSKVEWTISMSGSPEYRSGRTAVGSVVGPGHKIAVRFPDSATAQIEALKSGDTLDVTARIVEWNSLYDRAECEAYVAG